MRVELRLVRHGRPPSLRVADARDAFAVLRREARGLDRERFWRLDLDSRRGLIGYERVSVGSLDASIVTGREVFKGALLDNARRVIVAHNHPSGDPRPSVADRRLTATLVLAGRLLDVDLDDHLILAGDRYFSFREQKLL